MKKSNTEFSRTPVRRIATRKTELAYLNHDRCQLMSFPKQELGRFIPKSKIKDEKKEFQFLLETIKES